jgi:hypothetical protein
MTISFVLGVLLTPSQQELRCKIEDEKEAIQKAKVWEKLTRDPVIGKSKTEVLSSWGAPEWVQDDPRTAVFDPRTGKPPYKIVATGINNYWQYKNIAFTFKNGKCDSWYQWDIY